VIPTTPLSGMTFDVSRLGLATINIQTKFIVSNYTPIMKI